MPLVPFDAMPDDARVWIFAADRPLSGEDERVMLAAVDDALSDWKAHGEPLTAARDWRDGRFLAIAVDQRSAGASGCSIDGMFRTLKSLEQRLRTSLTAGGRVFFREEGGSIRGVGRDDFEALAGAGTVGKSTRVFDTSITSAGAWRQRFELEAGSSWHASLIG